MRIYELEKNEQPRQRLLIYGVESLSNVDLLSIIIRTGTKNMNVRDVSYNILNKIKNINNLDNISISELSNIKGVGKVKAMNIVASLELGKRVLSKEIELNMILNNSNKIFNSFNKYFINLKQEKFMLIMLDVHLRLIAYKVLYIGIIDSALVSSRDIFREAILNNSSNIVIIHNHPSGDLTPSKNDINITNKLVNAGNLFDIKLVDHLITNGYNYLSMKNSNIIK